MKCRLQINWYELGLDENRAKLYAPPIEGFQNEALFQSKEEISVEPGKGWLLILEEEPA